MKMEIILVCSWTGNEVFFISFYESKAWVRSTKFFGGPSTYLSNEFRSLIYKFL